MNIKKYIMKEDEWLKIFEMISSECPTSREIKVALYDRCAAIISIKNDTWGFFRCYSKKIEQYLEGKVLNWAYAFEVMEGDYPWISMFISQGDAAEAAKEIIKSINEQSRIEVVEGKFKDVCDNYNRAYTDELSEFIMQIADKVIEIHEV